MQKIYSLKIPPNPNISLSFFILYNNGLEFLINKKSKTTFHSPLELAKPNPIQKSLDSPPSLHFALSSIIHQRIRIQTFNALLIILLYYSILKYRSYISEYILIKMREIVHIQAGQCGNQIGAKVKYKRFN